MIEPVPCRICLNRVSPIEVDGICRACAWLGTLRAFAITDSGVWCEGCISSLSECPDKIKLRLYTDKVRCGACGEAHRDRARPEAPKAPPASAREEINGLALMIETLVEAFGWPAPQAVQLACFSRCLGYGPKALEALASSIRIVGEASKGLRP